MPYTINRFIAALAACIALPLSAQPYLGQLWNSISYTSAAGVVSTRTDYSWTASTSWPFIAGEFQIDHPRHIAGFSESILSKEIAYDVTLFNVAAFESFHPLLIGIDGDKGVFGVPKPKEFRRPYFAGLGPFDPAVADFPTKPDPFDRESVAAFVTEFDTATRPAQNPTWTGYGAGPEAFGTISEADRRALARRINFFRALAGLNSISYVDQRGSAAMMGLAVYGSGLTDSQRATIEGYLPLNVTDVGAITPYPRWENLRVSTNFGALPASHLHVNKVSLLGAGNGVFISSDSFNGIVDKLLLAGSTFTHAIIDSNATVLSIGAAGGPNTFDGPTRPALAVSTASTLSALVYGDNQRRPNTKGVFGPEPSPMNWQPTLSDGSTPILTMQAWPYAGYVPYSYVGSRWSLFMDSTVITNSGTARSFLKYEVLDEADKVIASHELRGNGWPIVVPNTFFMGFMGDSVSAPLPTPAIAEKPTRERAYRVRVSQIAWRRPNAVTGAVDPFFPDAVSFTTSSTRIALPPFEYDVIVFDPEAPETAKALIPTEYPLETGANQFKVRGLGQYESIFAHRPWIKHSTLGWLYARNPSKQLVGWKSHFFDWTSKHWWWTSEQAFPWIWDYNIKTWLYYSDSIAGERWFYRWDTKVWVKM